jgi:ABC-type transport system substrate-binding protein
MNRVSKKNMKAGAFAVVISAMFIAVAFSGCTTTKTKEPTLITLYYNSGNDARKLGCQLLKDNINNITSDLKIEIQELAWAQYLDKMSKKEMPIFFCGWIADYPHADDFVAPFAWSQGTYANRVGLNDSQIDAWIAEGQRELNATKSAEIYAKIEQKLFDQAVYLYVDNPLCFRVMRDWVKGFFYSPLFSENVWKYLSKNGSADDTTFVEILSGGPQFLDPAYDYESAGGEILQNVYETLIYYKGNSTTELEPILATEVPTVENGGISADGMTYTFHLRQGVKFHDGTTMNASAVKYSIDRAMFYDDPDSPGFILTQCLDVTNTSSVEVVNESTVRFHLEFPYAPFLQCIAFTVASIVSPTYVEANGGIQPRSEGVKPYMDTHMCGTGPFMLESWATDNSNIVLKKNPNYWGEEPAFDTVRVEYVDEYNTRYLALTSGDADYIYVPREHAKELETVPGIKIVKGLPTMEVNIFGYNQAIPPLDNLNLRKALCYAFDYQTYYNTIQSGITSPLQGCIPANIAGHDFALPIYTQDITKAKEYLTLAGYTVK